MAAELVETSSRDVATAPGEIRSRGASVALSWGVPGTRNHVRAGGVNEGRLRTQL